MEDLLKKPFLFIILILVLTGCSGGGSGNSVTISGGDSGINAASKQKIVFAGASSIARGNWSAYFGITIDNRGVGGFESSDLLKNITGYVASQPDKIFIMIGANNILNRHEGVLLNDISTIIRKIKVASPKTKIYIHSILPMKSVSSNQQIEFYNGRIQNICTNENVKFINIYNLFKSSSTIINLSYYVADGIHLTEAGYKVWADAIRGDVLS